MEPLVGRLTGDAEGRTDLGPARTAGVRLEHVRGRLSPEIGCSRIGLTSETQ
ncbi:MAG TPA: hypothetical protein VFB78_01395 [Acidimicrobiales bacterium]|nr:hypothetical protein [Acidimicrobiales bacterium]